MLTSVLLLLCTPVCLIVVWRLIYHWFKRGGHSKLRAHAWGAGGGLCAGLNTFLLFVFFIPEIKVTGGDVISLFVMFFCTASFMRCARRKAKRDTRQTSALAGAARSNVAEEIAALKRIKEAQPKSSVDVPSLAITVDTGLLDKNVLSYPPAADDNRLDHLWKKSRRDKPKASSKGVKRSRALSRVSETIQFTYRDYEGNVSLRTVEVWNATSEHFQGFCHARSAMRTFRYDRVRGKIVRLDTGEMLTSEAWRREVG